MRKHSCENCKWYDVVRGVGSDDDIPKRPNGERHNFCGYHGLIIADEILGIENNCDNFTYIFDDFSCKACPVCTKETAGECSPFMCKNCATCSLKHWGACSEIKCHDCGFCEEFETTYCYQDMWHSCWDIEEIEIFHDTVIDRNSPSKYFIGRD